jgi:ribose transport system permease protein
MEPNPGAKRNLDLLGLAQRIASNRILLLIFLIIALGIWMTIANPNSFPQADNFAAVLLDSALGAIMTVGMMLLLISGSFDLSVGGILAFAGVVAGTLVKVMDVPPVLAFFGGILSGTFIGLVNGFIITKLRINALITTLAMQYILRGATQLVAASGVANLPDGFKPFGQTKFLGLQSPFWIAIVIVLIAHFAMSRMRYFRQYYFVGSNPKAATLSGIKTERLTLVGFVIMGTLAGLSGVLLASRLSNAVVLAGQGTELKAITSAILGGASLFGGVGTIIGGFLGVIFMSEIQNALILSRTPVFWQSIVVGMTLLIAIGIDQLAQRRR